jgi:hypothetical protein
MSVPRRSAGSSIGTWIASPGDPRFEAFLRTFVAEEPSPGDAAALADLRRDPDAEAAFSLYLRAKDFHEAIVTLTEEGDLVLGLGLDRQFIQRESIRLPLAMHSQSRSRSTA